SRICSDGFIDRANSDLRSFYLSSAYLGDKSSLRFNMLMGKEKTYQAWYGISQDDLDAGRRSVNTAGTEKPGSPYDNETDNYWQNHYQLFFTHRCNENLSFNTALFLTSGKGYYEQYKAGETYTSYGLPGNGSSDFIRELWLDNDFFGNTFSVLLKGKKTASTLGGSVTRYNGKHFGELVWASQGLPQPRYRWYDLTAHKTDWNLFFKQQVSVSNDLHLFYDLQFRPVRYTINGFRENPLLKIHNEYNFFNPKAGVSYIKNKWNYFFSAALASKEPNRDDFEAGMDQQPIPERLIDLEAGTGWSGDADHFSGTIYYMRYKDQLVLTGKINDVGAYTRTNIPESFRLGIELEGKYQLCKWMNIAATMNASQNKVLNFAEFIDDYDMGGQQIKHYQRSDIAYSPSIVAGVAFSINILSSLSLDLLSKYVSRQNLDNTGVPGRSLDPFYVQDLRLEQKISPKWAKEINIIFQVNNLFNNSYEPNGYTYNYIYGGELSVNNYYFPMAGINFIAGLNIKF
ncbi:MAG TPA: TonB-dependent receptor, partial [Chitinophagaceae bacterium]|nr:TonB-dependent receptor [Chitinophagaceae bacterium]